MKSLIEENAHQTGQAASLGEVQAAAPAASGRDAPIVLSFDVEEHHKIEAAAGLNVDSRLQAEYRERMTRTTQWILEQLAAWRISATFFIVGQIAETNAALVRSIHDAGHEVASH